MVSTTLLIFHLSVFTSNAKTEPRVLVKVVFRSLNCTSLFFPFFFHFNQWSKKTGCKKNTFISLNYSSVLFRNSLDFDQWNRATICNQHILRSVLHFSSSPHFNQSKQCFFPFKLHFNTHPNDTPTRQCKIMSICRAFFSLFFFGDSKSFYPSFGNIFPLR